MCYVMPMHAQPSTLVLNARDGVSKEDQLNRRVGKTIAKKRTTAGYTQEQVAEKLGIGTEAFSRIERGINAVSVARLFELADMFHIGVETFLIEGSRRQTEQAERITQMLDELSAGDRQLIVQVVEKLARRLKGDPKRSQAADDSQGFPI